MDDLEILGHIKDLLQRQKEVQDLAIAYGARQQMTATALQSLLSALRSVLSEDDVKLVHETMRQDLTTHFQQVQHPGLGAPDDAAALLAAVFLSAIAPRKG